MNLMNYFSIEKKQGDTWIEVNAIIEEYGFNDMGYILSERQTTEIEINWEWLYGELTSGEYRVIKKISPINPHTNEGTYFIPSSEFIID